MPSAAPLPDSQIPTNPPDLSKKLPKLTPRRRPQPEQHPSNPPPPTPALPAPPALKDHKYLTPTRRILSGRDHQLFQSSPAHNLVVSFVFTLSDSVHQKTISDVQKSDEAQDPAILALLGVLDEAERILKDCPPLETGSRFGNPAFRTYLEKVTKALPSWHRKLGITDPTAVDEISTYLSQSFGNSSRIDYGSGHELNLILWLLCLYQQSLLRQDLFPALTLIVFAKYLTLMRKIQVTYYLEPAGSHGVWGLDDYQFLPFLFGASQLASHPHLRPLSIHNPAILEECSKDYLYLDQISWVNSTKTVQNLRWHSPMLDDISSAKTWAKVEAGMRRMFLAEVLGKLPVAQHFLFGSWIPAAEGMGDGEVEGPEGHEGHAHGNGSSWGDCCGIKVPSAVGAREEARKRGEDGGGGLRRLPFD